MNILKFYVYFLLLVFSTISCAEEWKYSLQDFIGEREIEGKKTHFLLLEPVDYYLDKIREHALYYPPSFKDLQERKFIESKLIDLIGVLKILDAPPSKNIEFLWRYGQSLAMAHNLDINDGYNSADNAIKVFERALAIDPDNIQANYFYGVFLSYTVLHDKAIPYLQHAIRHGKVYAKYRLAAVYAANKKTWPEAIELFEEWIKMYPRDETVINIVKALKEGKIFEVRNPSLKAST